MPFDATPCTFNPPALSQSDIVSNLLTVAANQIRRGWCQGSLGRDTDGTPTGLARASMVCAIGALHVAHMQLHPSKTMEHIMAAEYAVTRIIGCPVAQWNDHPSRTKNEVITALQLAAVLVRQGHAAA